MKFFISSTYSDLKNIRQVAINTIESLINGVTGQIAAMEYFAASPEDSKSICLEELCRSDIVIGIYANRFGWTSDDGRSMTEIEFDEAKRQGKPILAFVENHIEDNAEENQKRFLNEKVLQPDITCAKFDLDRPEDFAKRLNDTLKEYFKDLEGYSYHSVWDEINEMKVKIEKDDELPRMIPFGENEESLAFQEIVECAQALDAVTIDLSKVNDAVYDLAYDLYYNKQEYDDLVDIEAEKEQTLINIDECKESAIRNWETICLGLPNMSIRILLAVNYLRLCWVQRKLITEPWTEELREEIVKLKAAYINQAENESYLMD